MEIDPSEYRVMITEPPHAPEDRRRWKAEIMFENFEVEGLYIGIKGLLSLYASGLDTGSILSINPTVTYAIPVF